MTTLRFELGDQVMCNLGSDGWKLGKIIALDYREDHWPSGQIAPYQVFLEDDHALIYVPEDDALYCREPTPEDLRIARRTDALAALPPDQQDSQSEHATRRSSLECCEDKPEPGRAGYRNGRCQDCDCCPCGWTSVELYSEHYRCAERNGLTVTRHAVDLGAVCVGETIAHPADSQWPVDAGFLQCPTLVRLPPGVAFSDDGSLAGQVQFDPHRETDYHVQFVAVSTERWNDAAVGIVRLEITFTVRENVPPDDFAADAFARAQDQARDTANDALQQLGAIWDQWGQNQLSNRDTCNRMWAQLDRLRDLLEEHPRLDDGQWWTQLGGYHMNVHKLLENALFECELYLGHALTFEDPQVRWLAEQNLKGCYQKRLLEAARFQWIDGLEQIMRGEWETAAETLHQAAAKHDGWGWAVNFGDIWFTESAARLVHGAQRNATNTEPAGSGEQWITDATQLLEQGVARTREAEYFGPEGHPWAVEIAAALQSYRQLQKRGADATAMADWQQAFQMRTTYWCAQVLGGVAPFPPQPRSRRTDAAALVQRMPQHT